MCVGRIIHGNEFILKDRDTIPRWFDLMRINLFEIGVRVGSMPARIIWRGGTSRIGFDKVDWLQEGSWKNSSIIDLNLFQALKSDNLKEREGEIYKVLEKLGWTVMAKEEGIGVDKKVVELSWTSEDGFWEATEDVKKIEWNKLEYCQSEKRRW